MMPVGQIVASNLFAAEDTLDLKWPIKRPTSRYPELIGLGGDLRCFVSSWFVSSA